MNISNSVTKKYLEIIITETFNNFGFISASFLLDSLKLLGFFYSTTSGLSINIEDLKTFQAQIRNKSNKQPEK